MTSPVLPVGAAVSTAAGAAAPSTAGVPAPGGAGGAPLQERQAAADAEVAAGRITRAQADAWLAPPAPAAPGAPGTASAAMVADIADIANCISTASLSEAKTLLSWEIEAGRLSKSQADEMLAKRGDPVEGDGAPAPKAGELSEADLRAEGAKFDFTGMHSDETSNSPEHQALDQTARAWLVDAGFEKGPGSFIAQQVNRVGAAWQKMNDGQRVLHARHQDEVLRNLWKGDYERNMGMAAQLVAELEVRRPGLRALLTESGGAYDPLILSQIYNRARELADKRGITSWPPKGA